MKTVTFFLLFYVAVSKSIQAQDIAFSVLPTGYGKSLIFEALPYFRKESGVIIISPLNSIIEEQIQRLDDSVHLTVEKLSSNDSETGNNYTYILGHPEVFVSKSGILYLKGLRKNISHIVVDEAHCVAQWGGRFRKDYQELGVLRSIFPEAKVLALTATATVKMRSEISVHLCMKNVKTVSTSMDRPNIKLTVKKRSATSGINKYVESSYDEIFQPLGDELFEKQERFPKTIVYTKLKWCGYGHEMMIRQHGDSITEHVAQYHSPCTKEMRSVVSSSMCEKDGMVKLLFATEAYSMGTNAPDVRRIIHAGVPGTLETYIQEIGRSGRDGKPASATMFYNNTDISTNAKGMTDEMREYCVTQMCRRKFLGSHFGEHIHENIENNHDCCDNCVKVCSCSVCEKESDTSDTSVPGNNVQKNRKVNMAMVSCIEDALMEYFDAENSLVGTPMASLQTGLNRSVACSVSEQYQCFDKDEFLNKNPLVKNDVASNIEYLIDQCLALFN